MSNSPKWSAKDLGERFGVSASTISNLLKVKGAPQATFRKSKFNAPSAYRPKLYDLAVVEPYLKEKLQCANTSISKG